MASFTTLLLLHGQEGIIKDYGIPVTQSLLALLIASTTTPRERNSVSNGYRLEVYMIYDNQMHCIGFRTSTLYLSLSYRGR